MVKESTARDHRAINKSGGSEEVVAHSVIVVCLFVLICLAALLLTQPICDQTTQ